MFKMKPGINCFLGRNSLITCFFNGKREDMVQQSYHDINCQAELLETSYNLLIAVKII